MSYWTPTKALLALASIGILLAPTLRRLGYLRPDAAAQPVSGEESVTDIAPADAPPRKRAKSNGRHGRQPH